MPHIQKEPGTGKALFVCVSWVNCLQGPKSGHPLKVNAGVWFPAVSRRQRNSPLQASGHLVSGLKVRLAIVPVHQVGDWHRPKPADGGMRRERAERLSLSIAGSHVVLLLKGSLEKKTQSWAAETQTVRFPASKPAAATQSELRDLFIATALSLRCSVTWNESLSLSGLQNPHLPKVG